MWIKGGVGSTDGPTRPFLRKGVANADKALPWKEKITLPHGGGACNLTQHEDKVKSWQAQGRAEAALAASEVAAKGADGGKSWRQADRRRGGRQWQQRQGQVGNVNGNGEPVYQGKDQQHFQHYAPIPALAANNQEVDSCSDSGFFDESSEAAATDGSDDDRDIIVFIHADDIPNSGGKFREAHVSFEETSARITMALESGKVRACWTHNLPGAVDVSQCRFGLAETRHELKITFKKAERCSNWDVGVALHGRPPPEEHTSNADSCNQDDADSKKAGDNHIDDRNYDNAGCKDSDDRSYDTPNSPLSFL